MNAEQEVAALALPPAGHREDRLELGRGWQIGIGRDRLDDRQGGVRHPVDDPFEQRLLRVEVVVEGAFRDIELVQDVLDGHLLVALRPDETLGNVEEGVALDRMGDGVEGAGHPDLH